MLMGDQAAIGILLFFGRLRTSFRVSFALAFRRDLCIFLGDLGIFCYKFLSDRLWRARDPPSFSIELDAIQHIRELLYESLMFLLGGVLVCGVCQVEPKTVQRIERRPGKQNAFHQSWLGVS